MILVWFRCLYHWSPCIASFSWVAAVRFILGQQLLVLLFFALDSLLVRQMALPT